MSDDKVYVCPKCKEIKPETMFNRDNGKKSGRKSTCKSCESNRDRVAAHSYLDAAQYGFRKNAVCRLARDAFTDINPTQLLGKFKN